MATLGQYNLDEMTAQEVYEASAIHLLEQSNQSRSEEGRCVYNGDTVCCAAAPFIQNYEEGMEGNDWRGLVNKFKQRSSHSCLVLKLQLVHDSYDVRDWLFNLEILSKRYPELNLDNSFLDAWKWSDEDQKYYKE